MQDEIARGLFERVLEKVAGAEGDLTKLLESLAILDGDIRAMSLVRALLSADVVLAETFADADHTLRDRQLARRMALTVTARADRIEADAPGRAPVRVADLDLRNLAY